MRLVEFLIYILEAHAQTLQRLAALLGENVLIELLEANGEEEDERRAEARAAASRIPGGDKSLGLTAKAGHTEAPVPGAQGGAIDIHSDWFEKPLSSASGGNSYSELEGAVREFRLSPVLEFHLWAYPYYRAFIESELDLASRIPGPGGDKGLALVDEAVTHAHEWIKKFDLPSPISMQAERAAEIPWLRFRAEVLKRIGKRPMGPVY